MPIIGGKYVNPGWNNGTAPYIDAAELNDMSDSIALLPIVNGGTGANDAAGARSNLGITPSNIGAKATANVEDVQHGGTGRNTLTSNAILSGNGTSNVKMVATANGAAYATSANGALTFGALPIAQGGTGSTSASAARTALGVAASSHNHAAGDITSGTLGVARGGTGLATLTSGSALIGNGTSAVSLRAITNNTTATAVSASTNLITANTLYYHTGNSNITTVGTITSGKWQSSTAVAIAYGGTGATTAANARSNLGITLANIGVVYSSSTPAVTNGYIWLKPIS